MEPPQSPDELVIELLTKSHQRKEFSCGKQKLDEYVQLHARKNTEYGYGRTYVAVKPGDTRVWAFYTLAASEIDAKLLPSSKGCPKLISVIKLGRLGVDSQIQRIGVGQMLMGHAFHMSVEAAERVGVHAVVLDAKDEDLIGYYNRYGFSSLMDDPLHMYLAIQTIAKAMNNN